MEPLFGFSLVMCSSSFGEGVFSFANRFSFLSGHELTGLLLLMSLVRSFSTGCNVYTKLEERISVARLSGAGYLDIFSGVRLFVWLPVLLRVSTYALFLARERLFRPGVR